MSLKLTRRAATKLMLSATVALGSLSVPAFAQDYTEDNPLKVAFVVHGTLGDKSFLDSAAAGLAKAEDELPVEATVIEAGIDRSRWEPALADAADQGYDVVIGGTWEMTGFIADLAEEFPDTKFIIFDDAPDYSAGDYSNVLSIMYQTSTAAYLAGYAAGKLTETNKIGEILGVEGSTVLEFAVGFEQGAKAANPDVTFMRAVAGSFTDPAKGKELALAQFDQGADIIFPIAGGTGVGSLQAARDQGKLAVGVDSDQATIFAETDPEQAKVIFTSVLKEVGESLVTALSETIDGTAPYGETMLLGLSDGAVGIAKNEYYDAVVSPELQAEVDKVQEEIANGDITVDTTMQ